MFAKGSAAQTAVTAIEEKLRHFCDPKRIGFAIVNSAGRIADANQIFLDMTGYARSDLEAGNISMENLTPAGSKGHSGGLFFCPELLRKDGSSFPIMAGCSKFDDLESDSVLYILDLSKKPMVQNQEAEIEKNFQILTESISHMVFISGPNGDLQYCNQHTLDYSGLEREDVLGMNFASHLLTNNGEDVLKLWMKAVTSGRPLDIEAPLRRYDGAFRWHLIRSIPIRNADGKITRWFGTATDVHDKRTSREHATFLAEAGAALASSLDYRTTLNNVTKLMVPRFADWCSVHIIEGDFIRPLAFAHVNPEQEKLADQLAPHFSLSKADLPNGPAHVMKTGMSELVSQVSEAVLLNCGNSAGDPELLRKMGFASYICVPLKVRDEILGTMCFVRTDASRQYDESDLVIVEELARRAAIALDNARLYSDAQTANKIKEEFLAILSHELRTPMTVILAHADILMRKASHLKELKPSIEAIYRNAEAQNQINNDLLDVSKIIAGKVNFTPTIVDPTKIVKATIDSVRYSAEAKGLQLSWNFDRAPASISADPTRLQQIAVNLITNSIKFTPSGGSIHIAITEQGTNCELKVSDTGEGVDPAFLPIIFDRFRQEDASRSRRHGGLGLGLSIVRHLVDLHGGTVLAESSGKNQGSTFTVLLPIVHTSVSRYPNRRR